MRHEEQFVEMDARIESLAAKIGNITFLNRKSIKYQDTWIVGATLWTRTDSLKSARIGTENARHAADGEWLNKTLMRPDLADQKILVMTHHLPSYSLITPKFARHPRLFRWASASDDLIRAPVHTWICGHSHICNETRINNIPILINAATGKIKQYTIK
jgi:hypothetical protein